MAQTSSNTLLSSMEWSKKLNFSRSSAIGSFGEPAMTSANMVMQTILGAPFAWWWNRVMTGFITTPGQQDYTIFNYQSTTAVKLGWYAVDDAGNSQVCTTAGTTGSTAPTWSHTTTGTTSDGSVVWTNLGSIGNSELSSTYSFAWIETASVQETSSNQGTRWVTIETKQLLSLESGQGRPNFISGQLTDANGNITFRLLPSPNLAIPVVLTLQQKPPIFTKVSQSWSPIPDEYAHIYNWGFLALMWLFADDQRFSLANSKFVSALISTNQGLTDTEINVFLENWQFVTGQPAAKNMTMQQGFQARGNS